MTDYDAELKRLQDMALDHAIEEMDASDKLTVKSTQERGDRGFLTGMAAKSLGVAVRIEQFLALRRGEGSGEEEKEQEDAAKVKLVKTARTEVAKLMERAGVGNQPRK